MNFIYDILINLNQELYDFYEWNLNDNIMHVRKIPFFVVSSSDLSQFSNYTFRVSQDFLNSIYCRTEIFTAKDVEKVDYLCIFTDGKDCLCCRFDSSGVSLTFSKLLIDEAEELLELSERFNAEKIEYERLNPHRVTFEVTRKESVQKQFVLEELRHLEKKQDVEKLKYLYFECFDKIEDNVDNIMRVLVKKIECGSDSVRDKMYHFFKLISIHH